MKSVKAGRPLIEVAGLCYTANRPLLMEGTSGIGKSEVMEQAASQLGIGYRVCDLSLLDNVDLIGMPRVEGGRTVYAPPAWLPMEDKGLLVFEELNRCAAHVRAPVLQLLTARRLNDYRLPAGWLPMAAINPSGDRYETHALDPALLSRFVQVRVEADHREWLRWAEARGIHRAVIDYVRSEPGLFHDELGNPRSWAGVSDLLLAAEQVAVTRGAMLAAVSGLVGEVRATAFLAGFKKAALPVCVDDVLNRYGRHRATVQSWMANGRIDQVVALMNQVLMRLQAPEDYQRVRQDPQAWTNLGSFVSDLPGDLREQAEEHMVGRGYDSPLQAA